ncbi:MFS transporter [Mucilaginibacter sp. dw_454]|uniref:MFS transporter n=1 Tax=Mucilaginibacter sp. dw_454 TaxID=2720079 RepID=UPI001BD68FFA|nr:MFS transporter [Mucilaginibacter sp. dw_454]
MTPTAASAQKPHLTTTTLWVMTIATGLVVANLYYNQPLLVEIERTFKVSAAKAGQVSVFTQIGYAVGMFFIIPLADMFKRKRLMLIDFAFVVTALLLAAIAPNITTLIIASLLIGASSMIPQLLIPMAAHLAHPTERGKKIGVVMSGLLIGILLSRTFAGIIGAHFGWRAMFYIAAGLMLLMWALIYFLLPEVEPDYKGTYKNLMLSLVHLIRDEPKLRLAAVRGALCFACFSAFWSTLTFLLEQNFQMGSDVAGLFGLVGAFGALAVGAMGRLSDKMDPYHLSTFTLVLVIISFIVFQFSAHSMVGLIIGVVVMDMGVQATHISNQAIIFSINAGARNRINTIYMVTYFVGGALGTFIATQLWHLYQWNGVCILGIVVSTIATVLHLANRKKIQNKPTVVQS